MTANTRRVVCTGIGVVSPLGVGARKSWSALLQSRVGVRQLKNAHSFEGCQSRVAAYVPDRDLEDVLATTDHKYMVKATKQLSRATTFAMLASHEALKDAKLLDDNLQLAQQYRVDSGVAIGQGMVDFQDIYDNAKLILDESTRGKPNAYRKISPFFMTRALMNMSAGNVSIRYKVHGPNHCVSTACATGAHSIGDAFKLIKTNKASIMICGSTEASINSLAIAGFERLRALCTKYNDRPEAASRPFDENRNGFVMGEGAGIMILEELEHARRRGMRPDDIYGELLGYGMSSDAHHLTAPLPNGGGASKCMQAALEDANLEIGSITHINAHATSTPMGDDIECNAIEELFHPTNKSSDSQTSKNDGFTVTSCKGSIGHLLGGAGSVESIFALLSCKDALIPHCVNLVNQLATPKNLIQLVKNKPQPWVCDKRVLIKNSFGFGGTNASLVISNYQE